MLAQRPLKALSPTQVITRLFQMGTQTRAVLGFLMCGWPKMLTQVLKKRV